MKHKKALYRLAVLALALLLLGSGGYIVWKNVDYGRGAADYRAAEKAAAVPRLKAVPRPADGAEEAPDPNPELLAEMKLDSLQESNEDVLGWIVIPDTVLSYPLVQAGDNQYYLNHTWQNRRSSVGAIFMECECSPDLSDFNTIIYGHRMNNESMFGILHSYREESFWREHPSVYIVTDSAVRTYDIFAAAAAGIRDIVYRLDIEQAGREQDLIDFALEHSVIDTGIAPTPDDRILTLSTCTGRGHDTRWVVHAVLREETEIPDT